MVRWDGDGEVRGDGEVELTRRGAGQSAPASRSREACHSSRGTCHPLGGQTEGQGSTGKCNAPHVGELPCLVRRCPRGGQGRIHAALPARAALLASPRGDSRPPRLRPFAVRAAAVAGRQARCRGPWGAKLAPAAHIFDVCVVYTVCTPAPVPSVPTREALLPVCLRLVQTGWARVVHGWRATGLRVLPL